ncbi:MAG: ribonuclease HII [Gammaproteobacteria bacterium]|nr:ribonuclease HII [Gammaproteobacteria bacterium]
MQQQGELGFFRESRLIAGVDEVGRGPLAGPVVAAAVILDPAKAIEGLRDSKKLTEKRRDALYEQVRAESLAWALGICTPAEIDEHNILQASMLAMARAVAALDVTPEVVQVDGNRCPEIPHPVEAIVGGDDTIPAISAASIIAKVTRDRQMLELHAEYPAYAFDRHKGYPTPVHLAALKEHGVTPVHRRSFAPVRRCLEEVCA